MTNKDPEHATDGGSCWCGPPVEFFGGGYIVIHNRPVVEWPDMPRSGNEG